MAKYLEAISVNVVYAPAYYNIAVIYSELSRYEEALHYYHAAIQYNRFYVEAYCNIGVIYKNVGQLEGIYSLSSELLFLLSLSLSLSLWHGPPFLHPLSLFLLSSIKLLISCTPFKDTLTNSSMHNPHLATAAITFYDKALSINPNFTIAKSNMAIALTDYGTYIKNQGKREVSGAFVFVIHKLCSTFTISLFVLVPFLPTFILMLKGETINLVL